MKCFVPGLLMVLVSLIMVPKPLTSLTVEKIQNLGFSTKSIIPVIIFPKNDELFLVANFEETVKLSSNLRFHSANPNTVIVRYRSDKKNESEGLTFKFSQTTADAFVNTIGAVQTEDAIILLINYKGDIEDLRSCTNMKTAINSVRVALVVFDTKTTLRCRQVLFIATHLAIKNSRDLWA
jgi:hypothetical protein